MSDAPDVVKILNSFFPEDSTFDSLIDIDDQSLLLTRLKKMHKDPIHVTAFNQFMHLIHEGGVTPAFFKYYFQSEPKGHPYTVAKVLATMPVLDDKGISSLDQLEWGLRRFFIDALLYWGNIHSAYRKLRVMKSYENIVKFYVAKSQDAENLKRRGSILPLIPIKVADRYLISEIACKAYSPAGSSEHLHIEEVLFEAYRAADRGRLKIGSLFDKESRLADEEPYVQMMLEFVAEEIKDEYVEDEADIKKLVSPIKTRFDQARKIAVQNTRLYLSIVNELDVYVATSMRRRDDFVNMATDCNAIFESERLSGFRLRYFDPTMSATEGHEDKGLLECLMVKCAKAVVYFAGETDSFGKDAEMAMALSLGKPVIILCPDSEKGRQREQFFRDVHPLSRLIRFDTGVAIGAMVTRDTNIVATLLERIFDNRMEYNFEHKGDGYFRLKEGLTGSVVRLQTNWALLSDTFWNYYQGVQ